MTVVESIISESRHQETPYLTTFQPRFMDWTAARVFATKNLRIAIRYPANFLIWGILPLLWYAPYLLMMIAIAGPGTSQSFTELSGFDDFITFSVIAVFVYQYVDKSIWSVGNNFRWEQFSGTLEPLFVTPVPRISILVGAAFSDTIQCTFSASVLLIISSWLFGVTYAITMVAPIIVMLTMMVFGLYGFSFLIAGLILVFKDPSVLTELISNITYVLSPITYPLQALPSTVRYAAVLVPSTIAIITIRELAITGMFEPISFIQAFLAMLALVIAFWVIGILSFRWGERWTKDRGSMGGF
ncbi:MAG: ABC transporter permease [Candidatus Thorarchaeota archaeon]|nr:ABC transporter permease [Candidatus Thorarchaeota archaeon]